MSNRNYNQPVKTVVLKRYVEASMPGKIVAATAIDSPVDHYQLCIEAASPQLSDKKIVYLAAFRPWWLASYLKRLAPNKAPTGIDQLIDVPVGIVSIADPNDHPDVTKLGIRLVTRLCPSRLMVYDGSKLNCTVQALPQFAPVPA